MQIRLIALAALMAAGSAHALSPADIAGYRAAGTLKEIKVGGASAQRLFIASYAQSICNAGNFDVHHDANGTKIGNDYRAYSCTLSTTVGAWAAGTPVVIYKTDKGGSANGVFPILDAAAPGTVPFLNVEDASCVRTANPTPAVDILKPSYTCANASAVAATPHAGVSDVEPAIVVKPVNGGATQSTAQLDVKAVNLSLFGIAVTKTLYRALQEQQGIIGTGAAMVDVPADQSTWDASTFATIPSLPSSFVTQALAGKVQGGSTTVPGWNAVIGAAVDPAVASKQVNVCRREVGSGTQAAAQLHFLNNPIAAGTGAIAPAADNAVAIAQVGALAVKADSSTGNMVANCLTPAENAAAYALGIVSRENNPRANNGNATWRFVKIDGAAPHPSVARDGTYSYLYAATMQFNKTLVTTTSPEGKFIAAMRTNAGKPSSMNKFDLDNQYGYLSLPSTYTGLYSNLADPVAIKFGSRVERTSTPTANSATPLRLVK